MKGDKAKKELMNPNKLVTIIRHPEISPASLHVQSPSSAYLRKIEGREREQK
jgi:hypothetical protein